MAKEKKKAKFQLHVGQVVAVYDGKHFTRIAALDTSGFVTTDGCDHAWHEAARLRPLTPVEIGPLAKRGR